MGHERNIGLTEQPDPGPKEEEAQFKQGSIAQRPSPANESR